MTARLLVARAARLLAASALLLVVVTAAQSPVMPVWLTAAAGALFALTAWRPDVALLVLVASVPWGARMAGVPVRASEALCVAFLAGWLVSVWRPAIGRWAGLRPVALPACLYCALAVGSWLQLAFGPAPLTTTPVPLDYLVTAGRDPHTAAAVQILLGATLFVAAVSLVQQDARLLRRLAVVTAGVGLAAVVATVVAVPVRYWMTGDGNELIRYFVATRSRYAFHVQDVNAAGSHIIMAGLVGLGWAWSRRSWRPAWLTGLAFTLLALWIAGSRAANTAGLALGGFLLAGSRLVRAGIRWPSVPPRVLGALGVVSVVVLSLAPTILGSATATTGSASRSMSVREEFLVTSLRMVSTSPLRGVGVGTYYQRSSAFMPPGIRALYGRENAHNYFMQTTAELGVLGLMAFLWCLGAALGRAWRAIDTDGQATLPLGVFLGLLGFLLTCVTGHPFLVIEVSLPFWALLGAGAAAEPKVY